MKYFLLIALCLWQASAVSDWEYMYNGNLGQVQFLNDARPIVEPAESSENPHPVTAGLKRQSCPYVLCVEKITPPSNPNIRYYYATYNGFGSILLFWKFSSAEQGLNLNSPGQIKRGANGEAYVVFKIDSQVSNFLILSAEVKADIGQQWSIPSYVWVYAALWQSLCLDNGDLCLMETLSSDYRQRVVTAVNYRYVECSIQIQVKSNTNTKFVLYNGSAFTSTTVFVAPRRIPGSAPITISVYTAQQSSISDGWMYSFEFYGRRGDYRITADAYKYDLPFVGTYAVNQGYGGTFSHTGWSQYAIDWNVSEGTPVYSARDGVVANVREDQWLSKFDPGVCPSPVDQNCSTPGSDANSIIIRHSDGTWALYAHLKQNGATVTEGQSIKGKSLIGYSGNTGYSSGPHLHFQVTRSAKFDHPQGWISETLYVQYVDGQGRIGVPRLGGTYSANTKYPAQLSTIPPTVFPPYPPVTTPVSNTPGSTPSPSTDGNVFNAFFDMFNSSNVLVPHILFLVLMFVVNVGHL